MWPSEAKTCQRMRYSPGFRLCACDARVSAGASLVVVSDCVVASGLTSVRRERVASMRTLKRSLIGTVGPETTLLIAGLESNRIACATAERDGDSIATATTEHTARRIL